MISGRVENRRLFISVTVLDGQRSERLLRVCLDTGFDGDLTLPRDIIRQFDLAYRGTRTMILADGTLVETESYAAQVLWQNREVEALVFQSESEYLLGMSLLWEQRITIDAVEGGRISVEEIRPPDFPVPFR